MKLRIMGTLEEVQELTELLPVILNVSSVSKDYPNRGSSSEVRVYVDGSVEGSTITQAFKKYAEFKKQYDKMAMLLVVASEDGNVVQIHASTAATAFKKLLAHILVGKFIQTIEESIQTSVVKDSEAD